jgi:hypothetical protein
MVACKDSNLCCHFMAKARSFVDLENSGSRSIPSRIVSDAYTHVFFFATQPFFFFSVCVCVGEMHGAQSTARYLASHQVALHAFLYVCREFSLPERHLHHTKYVHASLGQQKGIVSMPLQICRGNFSVTSWDECTVILSSFLTYLGRSREIRSFKFLILEFVKRQPLVHSPEKPLDT